MRKRQTRKELRIQDLLFEHIQWMLRRKTAHFEYLNMPRIDAALAKRRRSIFIRHLDCGSCNGCELSLNALNNPVYDIEKYGIHFEASPRSADILARTGPYVRNLDEAARLTLSAMPEPRVIPIGDCAIDGGIFRGSYAVQPLPEEFRKAEERGGEQVPGCPPDPEAILPVLLKIALGILPK